jgi:hypothetical protein
LAENAFEFVLTYLTKIGNASGHGFSKVWSSTVLAKTKNVKATKQKINFSKLSAIIRIEHNL